MITLEDRNLNCFMRKLQRRPPPWEAKRRCCCLHHLAFDLHGLLRHQIPKVLTARRRLKPLKIAAESADLTRGEAVYAVVVARRVPRQERRRPEEEPARLGASVVQPGAVPAKSPQLAAWLKVAMLLDDPDLTDQEVLDVAAFVDSHDRPSFNLQDHLPDRQARRIQLRGESDQALKREGRRCTESRLPESETRSRDI